MSQPLRGWRQALRAYTDLAKRHPMAVGVATTLVKTSAADAFAQKVIERREELDWRRHFMFCGFGFAYLGIWQYYLYNNVFVWMSAGVARHFGQLGAAPVKTFVDQALHHPLIYFPSFYICKGAVEGRSLETSYKKCWEDMWPNLRALWMVWVPAQLINFGVVPPHLQIPFVACVSFIWTVIISVMRGALDMQSDASLTAQCQDYQTCHVSDVESSLKPITSVPWVAEAQAQALPLVSVAQVAQE